MTFSLTSADAFYGSAQVLHSVSVTVGSGELIALVGANGAGKSTLLRAMVALHRQHSGRRLLGGTDVTGLSATELANRGVSLVPEGRQLFAELTVKENLAMGMHGRVRWSDKQERARRMATVHELFPVLGGFADRRAGLLSGGQQQMLAIARAMVRQPQYLLLDEPSMGLAPLLVTEILATVRSLTSAGVGVMLAEQNAFAALQVADRGVVLENGRITRDGSAGELIKDPHVVEHYLGGVEKGAKASQPPRPLPPELTQKDLIL